MSAHTPRPWMANGRVPQGTRIDSLGDEKAGLDFLNGWVAIVRDPKDVPVIAAAPDLLAAAAYLVRMFSDTPPEELAVQIAEDPSTLTGSLDRARAAIAKAEGRL